MLSNRKIMITINLITISKWEQLSPSLPPEQEHQQGGKRVRQPHSGSLHPPTFRRCYVSLALERDKRGRWAGGRVGTGRQGQGGQGRSGAGKAGSDRDKEGNRREE